MNGPEFLRTSNMLKYHKDQTDAPLSLFVDEFIVGELHNFNAYDANDSEN